MFVGFDKNLHGGETNYLKIIFKMDQINQSRKLKRFEDEKIDTLRIGLLNRIDPNQNFDLKDVLLEPTDN